MDEGSEGAGTGETQRPIEAGSEGGRVDRAEPEKGRLRGRSARGEAMSSRGVLECLETSWPKGGRLRGRHHQCDQSSEGGRLRGRNPRWTPLEEASDGLQGRASDGLHWRRPRSASRTTSSALRTLRVMLIEGRLEAPFSGTRADPCLESYSETPSMDSAQPDVIRWNRVLC